MLTRLCANAGFDPQVAYRSNNSADVRGLVATGLGIAAVPALGHETTAGVTSIRLSGERAHREVFAVQLSRPPTGRGGRCSLPSRRRPVSSPASTRRYGYPAETPRLRTASPSDRSLSAR